MFRDFRRDLFDACEALFVAAIQTAIITIGSVAIVTACGATAWRIWTWIN